MEIKAKEINDSYRKSIEKVGTEFDPSLVLNLKDARTKEYEHFQKEDVVEIDTGRWAVHAGGDIFTLCEDTAKALPAGIYSVELSMSRGLYLQRHRIISDNLIKLPDDNSDEVMSTIHTFTQLKDKFAEMGFLYKRGILLYGPQGSGKSATVVQTIRKYVDNGGIAILGDAPHIDISGIQMIRRIESDRQIVAIYEDVDDTVRYYGDRSLTMMLDGEHNVENILYLATTNYPERLPARLLNRPSRFDVIKFIGLPSAEARYAYLNAKTDLSPSELAKWVKETDGLSIPHLKELIILVKVYNKSLDESIMTLKGMKRLPHSSQFTQETHER